MKTAICTLLLLTSSVQAGPIQCKIVDGVPQCSDDQLKVCEEVLGECNEKVKELDQYGKELKDQIKTRDDSIKQLNGYIDDLEAYAKANDAQSFWNRHKMLVGFIGGILLTTGLVIGVGQVAK